ncbi:NYN domain-containing protein [Allobranchiibius sp. GilTou38]|uniref:NYN domain-containing protein n=1 Tax=Allobranchiibius sp. GilTou38 TaxID=2815210 RepID=UPI001AA0BDA4|nr:NYN domain-containing protein [Allobranchiibius sp. GilTou38]MBO1765931.1 NYN domain-containing protein [Allobranchiibius sp. GilTou38]
MEPVRSVLFLDFDNVFSGLLKLDPKSALRFAEDPRLWVNRLAGGTQGVARRWLVLRCYMNPAGWVPNPENDGARLYFSRFRPSFTDAGFEVVDCPRLSHTKNGADIRLVIDAIDALRADVQYEEFVIASGDSDMTPLIVRLRASDRRITLLSPSDSAVVLGAVADRLIGGEDVLELLGTESEELIDPLVDDSDTGPRAPAAARTSEVNLTPGEANEKFKLLVVERYAQASEPINLATLANDLRKELGEVVTTSRWFGHDGFVRAVQALNLPDVHMSQHFLWDVTRHSPPTLPNDAQDGPAPPDPVARVVRALKLPSLPTESWRSISDSLAAFVHAYEFNLTEATRWSRDQLSAEGIWVSRQAVGIVARGAAYGGCPLYGQPRPSADAIAAAFAGNVLSRAAAADVDLSSDEIDEVQRWFGLP